MEKYRAIPHGYMTVGEVAKKMGVTVRTLQYYDREGLLSPSSESEGGRRLYTGKDVVKLYQILSMKSLGFSLDDIKNRLTSLNTPADVMKALTAQADAIREKLDILSDTLHKIEALKSEVMQMQAVDFTKYADIITNLQINNEYHWAIKEFDDKTLEHFRTHFKEDSALSMANTISRLLDKAIQLQKDGVSPKSESGIKFAKAFWGTLMNFTGGNMAMLPDLMKVGNTDSPDNEWNGKQEIANTFIEPALEAYFTTSGIDPFEGGTT